MKIAARLGLSLILFVFLSGLLPARSDAEVTVSIGVLGPPPLGITGPPVMAVVPETAYVYYIPSVPADVFFYRGYWYRPHGGHWFRARSYRGPWSHMDRGAVSPVLAGLPPGYRKVPPGHQKTPYGQLKRNWHYWEKERYWDRAGMRQAADSAPRGGREARGQSYEYPGKEKGRWKN